METYRLLAGERIHLNIGDTTAATKVGEGVKSRLVSLEANHDRAHVLKATVIIP